MGFFEIPAGAARRARLHDEIPAEVLPVFEEWIAGAAGLPDPGDLSAEQRAGAIKAVHRVQVMAEAYLTQVAGVADERKDSRKFSAGTTGVMVASLMYQNPVVGSGMVKRARALRDMPGTEVAYRQGLVSGRHVQTLIDAAEQVDTFHASEGESSLVGLACTAEPSALTAVVKVLIDACRPEVLDEDYRAARERRRVKFSELPDATWQITGILDPVAGRRLADAFAACMDPKTPEDRRTVEQRRADALDDLIAAGVANTNPLGVSGILITADIDALVEGRGGQLDGVPIGRELFEALTCTGILNIILGKHRGSAFVPLMHGRSKRRASAGQWAALIARDAGCVNCGRGWRYTEAHHVIHWKDGGLTDLSNLCLLCPRCHRDLHLGYFTIVMVEGLPEITVHRRRKR